MVRVRHETGAKQTGKKRRARLGLEASWLDAKVDRVLPGATVSYQRVLHEVHDKVNWQLRGEIVLRGNGIPPETPVCSLQ